MHRCNACARRSETNDAEDPVSNSVLARDLMHSERVEFDRVSGNNRDHRKTLTKRNMTKHNMHAGYSAQRLFTTKNYSTKQKTTKGGSAPGN